MLLSVLLAIILTFVTLQNCPNMEKDSKRLKNESFVNLTNSTNLMEKDSEEFKNKAMFFVNGYINNQQINTKDIHCTSYELCKN